MSHRDSRELRSQNGVSAQAGARVFSLASRSRRSATVPPTARMRARAPIDAALMKLGNLLVRLNPKDASARARSDKPSTGCLMAIRQGQGAIRLVDHHLKRYRDCVGAIAQLGGALEETRWLSPGGAARERQERRRRVSGA